jgi:uncharacterized protein (DUF983 family)
MLISMGKPRKRKGVFVRCPNCFYGWKYRGKSKIYITCPQCLKKFKPVGKLRKIGKK